MADSKMTIRTMISGLILALKELQSENKRLTKIRIRYAHQRDSALARLGRAASKIRELEAKHKRLRASLAKKRKKFRRTI